MLLSKQIDYQNTFVETYNMSSSSLILNLSLTVKPCFHRHLVCLHTIILKQSRSLLQMLLSRHFLSIFLEIYVVLIVIILFFVAPLLLHAVLHAKILRKFIKAAIGQLDDGQLEADRLHRQLRVLQLVQVPPDPLQPLMVQVLAQFRRNLRDMLVVGVWNVVGEISVTFIFGASATFKHDSVRFLLEVRKHQICVEIFIGPQLSVTEHA